MQALIYTHKVLFMYSDSPGLVDFAIRLVNSVFAQQTSEVIQIKEVDCTVYS